jgi:hypothetical protein
LQPYHKVDDNGSGSHHPVSNLKLNGETAPFFSEVTCIKVARHDHYLLVSKPQLTRVPLQCTFFSASVLVAT